MDSEFERRLAVGAQLACQLRTAVKDKLGTQAKPQTKACTSLYYLYHAWFMLVLRACHEAV